MPRITRTSIASWLLILIAIVAGSLLTNAVAQAQSAQWRVEFTASPDHSAVQHGKAVVERYDLVVTPDAGGQATTIPLGKPSPSGSQNRITVNINAALLALPEGQYTGRVHVVGPGGATPSAASDPFVLAIPAPAAPGKPGVSKAAS